MRKRRTDCGVCGAVKVERYREALEAVIAQAHRDHPTITAFKVADWRRCSYATCRAARQVLEETPS